MLKFTWKYSEFQEKYYWHHVVWQKLVYFFKIINFGFYSFIVRHLLYKTDPGEHLLLIRGQWINYEADERENERRPLRSDQWRWTTLLYVYIHYRALFTYYSTMWLKIKNNTNTLVWYISQLLCITAKINDLNLTNYSTTYSIHSLYMLILKLYLVARFPSRFFTQFLLI